MDTLPLGQITWEEFQRFCEALIRALPGFEEYECHQYGVSGDKQEGIDIFATRKDGSIWAFQCKREKQFGPAKVNEAVQATTYEADKYIIVLSRTATGDTRKEVAKYNAWDIWDAEDISQIVRDVQRIPREAAYYLVQDHFGAETRKAFLGIEGLPAFVSSASYFRDLQNSSNLFHHNWTLVGRQAYLTQLHEFVNSEHLRVAILTGRGGIGKSKILHAFSDTFSGNRRWELRFVNPGLPLSPDSADELTTGEYILVADDVHRLDDTQLQLLLTIVRQRQYPTKLILTSRPHVASHIRSLLSRTHFSHQEIHELDEVSDLSREEVKELARQALGEQLESLVEPLVKATRDCPLITVVGGQMLAQNRSGLPLLIHDDEFRYTVLDKFQDDQLLRIGKDIEAGECRKLLDMLAAVAPIHLDNEEFLEKAAEFLQLERDVLIRRLDLLKTAGILLRRGRTLRLVPDVLSDHTLYRACMDSREMPTGYAKRVFHHFSAVCITEVFRNLSELDWRIYQKNSAATHLLDSIWQSVEVEFKNAPNSQRSQILGVLASVAIYQPAPVLRIVEYAMHNPATVPDEDWLAHYYDHNSIVRDLPELLKQIACHPKHRSHCCDLLWELGKSEQQNPTLSPDGAIRILQNMASYDIGKPYLASEIVIDAAARWLQAPDAYQYVHLILNIVAQALKKEGQTDREEGFTFVMTPFVISADEVKELRSKSLDIIEACLFSDNPRVTVRAIKSLDQALSPPYGVFDMPITEEQETQWIPEMKEIIQVLSDLASSMTNSLIHLHIIEAVQFYAMNARFQEIQEQCTTLLATIPDTYDLRLYRTLRNEFGRPTTTTGMTRQERDHAYKDYDSQVEQFISTVVEEFISRHPDPVDGLQALSEYWQALTEVGDAFSARMIFRLAESHTEYAATMCELLCREPDHAMTFLVPNLLRPVRHASAERGLAIIKQITDRNHPLLCRGLAQMYSYWNWSKDDGRDAEVLQWLANHSDLDVRINVIDSLMGMSRFFPEQTLQIVQTIDLAGSPKAADTLCKVSVRLLDRGLDDEQIEMILEKLEFVTKIDEYSIGQFLAKAAERFPFSVVKMLLNRIERGREDTENQFDPIPYRGLPSLKGVKSSNEYETILRLIRDHAINASELAMRHISRLYSLVSSGFAADSLSVLDEWILSEDEQRVTTAGRMLGEASRSFVFSHVNLVDTLLNKARRMGEECLRRVESSLFRSAISGIKSTTPGTPFPEDRHQHNRGKEIAARFPLHSPTYAFYDALSREAGQSIQKSLDEAEEMDM